MLISSLINNVRVLSDNDEDNLQQITKSVLAKLQPHPLMPATVTSLEKELVALFKRMCHPLKSSIEQHFSELSKIGLAQWIKVQLYRCPVLDKLLYEQSQQMVAQFALFENRYALDKYKLQALGLLIGNFNFVSVRIASADKHHGQHVFKLDFSDQTALYYKPRSGSGAQLLKDLSQVLSRWGLKLKATNILVCEGYHWMAEVPYEAALDIESAQSFAFSGGVLYAVASVLNASDLHFENIIASGEGPVVVDCETMCQPRFSKQAAAYLLKHPREEYDDVTSLFLNFDHYGGQDIDYGGLSCVDVMFRADPNAGLQLSLSCEQRPLVLHHSRSAVEVEGRRVAPAVEYFESFVQGLRHASESLKEHKEELLALIPPTAIFRVPLRATRLYAALMLERMSTIYFSSYASGAWSSHLESDLMHAPLEFLPSAQAILEQETMDIYALDIPAAYVCAGNRDLLLRNAVIPGVFDLSPLEVVRCRLDRLSDAVVDEQVAVLRARLAQSNMRIRPQTEHPTLAH